MYSISISETSEGTTSVEMIQETVTESVKMKVEEVLKLLEKHEDECNRRYAKIEKQLETLDMRLWGIAILIIGAAIVQKIF